MKWNFARISICSCEKLKDALASSRWTCPPPCAVRDRSCCQVLLLPAWGFSSASEAFGCTILWLRDIMPVVVTEAREDLVLDFFFLFLTAVHVHWIWSIQVTPMKYKGWLHTCVTFLPGALSIVEKPSTHSCFLGKVSPFSLSGIFCVFQYFLLASLEMTSVRKLVSRGAKDSKTGIWWITVSLALVPCEFFNSRHPLYSLQSAEPQSAAWLVSKKSNRHFRCSVTHPMVPFSLSHRGPLGIRSACRVHLLGPEHFFKCCSFVSSISELKISSHPPQKWQIKRSGGRRLEIRDVKGCHEFICPQFPKTLLWTSDLLNVKQLHLVPKPVWPPSRAWLPHAFCPWH